MADHPLGTHSILKVQLGQFSMQVHRDLEDLHVITPPDLQPHHSHSSLAEMDVVNFENRNSQSPMHQTIDSRE
jgi:hypothetical protein